MTIIGMTMRSLWARALCLALLTCVASASPSSGGANAGARAILSWSPTEVITDRPSLPDGPFWLYVHIEDAPDVERVLVSLRRTEYPGYEDCCAPVNAPQPPSVQMARVVDLYPSSHIFYGHVSRWKIIPGLHGYRRVAIRINPQSCPVGIRPSLVLAHVKLLDTLGRMDEAQIPLGGVHIRGGSGYLAPPHVTAVQIDSPVAVGHQVLITILGNHLYADTDLRLRHGHRELTVSVISHEFGRLLAEFTPSTNDIGTWDLVASTRFGDSDSRGAAITVPPAQGPQTPPSNPSSPDLRDLHIREPMRLMVGSGALPEPPIEGLISVGVHDAYGRPVPGAMILVAPQSSGHVATHPDHPSLPITEGMVWRIRTDATGCARSPRIPAQLTTSPFDLMVVTRHAVKVVRDLTLSASNNWTCEILVQLGE